VLNRWHLRNLHNPRLGSLIFPVAIAAHPPTVKKWKKGVTKWWKVGKSGKKS